MRERSQSEERGAGRARRLVVGSALLLVLVGATARADQAGPNVVLLVGDDMGYADIGVHGCRDIPTPSIDGLAANGVRFTNAYVSAPQCSPARAGLLTGRYQERFGHEFNLNAKDDAFGLPVRETTLADRMKAAGYATGLVGKWHLGIHPEYNPLKRGFDEFFGFLSGAHAYFPGSTEAILRGTKVVDEKAYLTDAIGREAVSFIDAHKAKPFFLYVAFNAVHTPMQGDPARLKRLTGIPDPTRRTYAAMMVAMDEAIGRVVAALKTDGLLDNTLIVFLNDNGGPTMQGVTVNGSTNAPLRGSKRTTLEGGIRVPFLLQWPARLQKGIVYDLPVIQLDVLPTVLAASGVDVRPEWGLDGVNLLPHLAGGGKNRTAPPHEMLFWRFGPQMAIRRGQWKLVKYDLAAEGGSGTSAAKLYDLESDIGEATDVAAQHPETVQALQQSWEHWNEGNVAPLWALAGQ